jgi:hypothetical protein
MSGYVPNGRSDCPCCGSHRIDIVQRVCLDCDTYLPHGSLDAPIRSLRGRAANKRYVAAKTVHDDAVASRPMGFKGSAVGRG